MSMDFFLRKNAPDFMHTPLHDLHSFFYVFLWFCAAYEAPGKLRKPFPDALKRWSGSSSDIVTYKSGQFGTEEFFSRSFKQYFCPYFEDLFPFAERFRAALNPSSAIGPEYQTHDISKHDDVLKLFNDELARLENEQAQHPTVRRSSRTAAFRATEKIRQQLNRRV
jgi:hypothetical protein